MSSNHKLGRPKARGITPAQMRALKAITSFKKTHGRTPTQSELADAMNLTAPAVRYLITQLREKKALTFRKGVSGSIALR